MSVYSAVFQEPEERHDINGRPVRATRGIPPKRYGSYIPQNPVNLHRTRSLVHENISRNDNTNAQSRTSNAFEVLTGRSSVVNLPITSINQSQGDVVTYTQVNRPAMMSTLPTSYTTVQPMGTSSVPTFVNYSMPSRTFPMEQIPIHIPVHSISQPMVSVNQNPMMSMNSCRINGSNGVNSREIPSSHMNVPTNQVPMSTFVPMNSMNRSFNVPASCNVTMNQSPMPINAVPVSQQSYNFFGSRDIPLNQQSVPVSQAPNGSQWFQKQTNVDNLQGLSNEQNRQTNHDSSVYQTVNSRTNLTRSSSIGSINSFTRNWVENLEPFTDTTPEEPQSCFARDKVLSDAFKALTNRQIRDLPTFSGDIKEWPIFYSEYINTTRQHNIQPSENIRRLRKALDKKARQTVQSLLTDEKHVDVIISILEKNFGQPEWVISTLIDELKSFPTLKDDNLELFRDFFNKVMSTSATIKNMNGNGYLNNPELLSCLVQKLPTLNKTIWGHFKANLIRQKTEVTLEHFCLWLEEELDAQFANYNPLQKKTINQSFNPRQTSNYHRRETVMSHNEKSERKMKCDFCQSSSHFNHKCDVFMKMTVEQRRDKVKEKTLCFVCLDSRHSSKQCPMRFKCKKCGARHHNLLHVDLSENDNKGEHSRAETSLFSKSFSNTLLRCGKVKLKGPNGVIEVFALYDDGSTSSQIESNLADELGLQGPISPITYQWTREICAHDESSRIVQLKISGNNSDKCYELKNVRTVENLALPEINFDFEKILSFYPMIDVEKLLAIRNAKPRILIGSNNGGLITPLKTLSYSLYGLQLCHCRLGWTIHGDIDPNLPSDKEFCFHIHTQHTLETTPEDVDLSQLIKQVYEVDDFGMRIQREKMSNDDCRAVAIMKRTMKRNDDRFEIGHLYKYDDFEFPESKTMALRRLYLIEKKMDRDENFADQYCNKIEDYVQKGYATKLDASQVRETAKTWYLPHFGVTNPNKPGKFRLVMDAKAKSNGYSLNDLLLKGPDFVPSLVAVIWRARLKRVAFMADIAEMFHQILMRQEDRDSQRFLFRGKNRDRQPDVYEMNVVMFGAISSPSVAQFVKNENAKEIENITPGVYRAIVKQHYVDDYFDSADDEETAIDMIKKVVAAHEKGGFKLVKFVTNSKRVTEQIPETLRSDIDELKPSQRVLGINWNIVEDCFTFSLKFEKSDQRLVMKNEVPTKRELLKFMMSIFDPIGFLSPITIQLKILFQDLWRENVHWDKMIPEKTFQKWNHWLESVKLMEIVSIPRSYFPKANPFRVADLHIFCDASEKAYAVAVYLRLVQNDQIFVSMICSKARVAPVKSMTIPKLELQGCVAGALLAQSIETEIDIQITKKYFWTDSKVVISWLQTKDRLNMFVGSRVTTILEKSKVSEWHWLKSEVNVADLGTKDHDLTHEMMSKWLKGSDFLYLHESEWQIQREIVLNETEQSNFHTAIEPEIERVNVHTECDDVELPDVKRFSNFHRLIRATAFYLKMLDILQLKKHEKPKQFGITVDDMCRAKLLWYRKAQKDEFYEEIQDLTKHGYVKTGSRLRSFSPFLHEGVIRMSGRMPNQLNFEENNPVILPSKHALTRLLIKTYHEANLHIGLETVVNSLRQKFRILDGRTAVKRHFRDCDFCKERKAKTYPVRMGPLPIERNAVNEYPFTHTGLDYFGPILVKHGRKLEKHWGVIFTCLTVRAIHIEVVPSLNTSSCIMAIRRFMNIRGVPKTMISDNGTCFTGAKNELNRLIKQLDQNEIQDKLSVKNVKWSFITPGAPHQGGCWERLVRSIKVGLHVTLNGHHPTLEVLMTSLSEIMNTINNRPLTHISDDPHESCALTPNDILLGRVNNSQFDHTFDERDVYAKNLWKNSQVFADRFWRRWVKEYRPQILKRTNWFDDRNEVEFRVGDVVMLIDESLKRGSWPKGLIQEIQKNPVDGKVRNATVKTNSGTFSRPVTKIAYLFTP